MQGHEIAFVEPLVEITGVLANDVHSCFFGHGTERATIASTPYNDVDGVFFAIRNDAIGSEVSNAFAIGIDEVNIRLVESRKEFIVEAGALTPAWIPCLEILLLSVTV